MLDSVTLVAMTRSGATLVLRDRVDRLWLYPPEGAGRPRVVSPELADQVIARQDMERVDRDFQSWQDLDEFRQERASALTPTTIVDLQALDPDDIESLLGVAERWRAEGDAERARRLVIKLLGTPVARADEALHARLLALLERLEEPRLDIRPGPRTPRQAAARERWQQPRAA
jgi:hypothetical protein